MKVLIRKPEGHEWVRTAFQNLAVMPGMSRVNRLESAEDKKARLTEMHALLEAGAPEKERLVRSIEDGYGRPLRVLVAEIRSGGAGIDQVTGPWLLIDSMGTTFEGGRHLMVNGTTKERAIRICRAVGDGLGVDWVGAMHYGHFKMLKVAWQRNDVPTDNE